MEIKIKLKVRDVEIELTKDEAVKLKELLNEMTGKEVVKEYVSYYPWRYWWSNEWQPQLVWTSGEYTCDKTIPVSDSVAVTYTVTQ